MENRFYRREKQAGGWRKRSVSLLRNRRILVTLSVAGPLLLFVLFNNRGVIQRIKLEQQKEALVARVRQLETDQAELRRLSQLLDGDRAAIEKVAREKYGMLRDGETIYRVHR